jgi:hypothetical protein
MRMPQDVKAHSGQTGSLRDPADSFRYGIRPDVISVRMTDWQ